MKRIACFLSAIGFAGCLLVGPIVSSRRTKTVAAQPVNGLATNPTLVLTTNIVILNARDDEAIRDAFDEEWTEPKAFARTNVVIYWRGEFHIYRMDQWLKYGTTGGHVIAPANSPHLSETLRPYHPK